MHTWARRALLPVFHIALVLAVAPWIARPFSTPKLWALAAFALAAGALALRTAPDLARAARAATLLALAWLALLCASAWNAGAADPPALARDGAGALLVLALVRVRPDPRPAFRAIAAAGALLAAVTLLQRLGADVWGASAQGRLALHGTLGNPDFVAAWLGAALPLAIVEATLEAGRPRLLLAAAVLLQGAALVATGSFATLAALAAAAGVLAVLRRGKLSIALAAIALAAALVAAPRDPLRALAGRAYLHRVAAAHVLDAPLLGHGPGAVRALWPGWEADRWAAGLERRDARRFAAAQDHVHDDWLERALELGVPAACVLLALAAVAFAAAARRAADPRAAALAASIAALGVRACFDFPLARPAELAFFATLIALACAPPEDTCTDPAPR